MRVRKARTAASVDRSREVPVALISAAAVVLAAVIGLIAVIKGPDQEAPEPSPSPIPSRAVDHAEVVLSDARSSDGSPGVGSTVDVTVAIATPPPAGHVLWMIWETTETDPDGTNAHRALYAVRLLDPTASKHPETIRLGTPKGTKHTFYVRDVADRNTAARLNEAHQNSQVMLTLPDDGGVLVSNRLIVLQTED